MTLPAQQREGDVKMLRDKSRDNTDNLLFIVKNDLRMTLIFDPFWILGVVFSNISN